MKLVLIKCFCGALPEIKMNRVCIGHGDYLEKYYVECSCGLRGKSYTDRDFNSPDMVALMWWQDFIRMYK